MTEDHFSAMSSFFIQAKHCFYDLLALGEIMNIFDQNHNCKQNYKMAFTNVAGTFEGKSSIVNNTPLQLDFFTDQLNLSFTAN